jgi:hypothetical protein
LVAVDFDRVVGHILFSPVAIEGARQYEELVLGLAPVAGMPEEQGKGIGSMLTRSSVRSLAYTRSPETKPKESDEFASSHESPIGLFALPTFRVEETFQANQNSSGLTKLSVAQKC